MTPLYTDEDFEKAKSRELLPLTCLHCSSKFFRKKHDIQIAIIQQKKGREFAADFCSLKCNKRHVTPVGIFDVTCDYCGKSFKKSKSAIKQTKHNFCNHSCAAIYGNAHKKYGTRVSKLEQWIASKLIQQFHFIDFHFNKTNAISSELDIYIPELKLAFELNGPVHYEPIYGTEKLKTIQTNDHRKMQACFEKGIELCVLDVSMLKYFKPANAKKYYDIIVDIISSKISRLKEEKEII